MTYTPQTRILDPTLGKAEVWIRYIRDRGGQRMDEVANFVREVYRIAPARGIAAHLVIAQAIHETDMFTSYWWVERLNPGGLGITGWGPTDNASRYFPDGTIAARAMVVHVALYTIGQLDGELTGYRHEDPRADNIPTDKLGTKQTLASYGAPLPEITWATDPNYGTAWARRLNDAESAGVLEISPDDGDNETDTPMPDMQLVQFVGLATPVEIPADITVTIDIVPDRFIGWVRSGQHFTGQTKTTFHDTGAPGQNARSQRNYLHNGPSEGGQRRQVGFNFAVDDKEIIQLTPLDEVTWAAGTPEGNRYGWHVEQCFGGNINWDHSLRNAIALHAGLIAAKGWTADTALVKHQNWSNKWCPAQVLNRGLWPSVVTRVDAAAKAIAGGVTAATVSVGDVVATTVNLNIRAEASTSAAIVHTLDAGLEARITGGAVTADGYTWWAVQHTSNAGEVTGWVAEASTTGVPYLVVTVDYVEPDEPTPEYAKPLAIAELAPYVGRPIVPMPATIELADGAIAVPVFDRVRAIRDTRRRRDVDSDADVGPDISAGEEFDVSFLRIGQGVDGTQTYITSYWTRIAAEDCEIISDVPRDLPAAEPAAA